jgi:hypothetical protein
MRSSVRVPIQKLLKLGLLAKVMLGATVVFASAGAVAATNALPEGSTTAVPSVAEPATNDPVAADLAAHEGLAHEGDADDAPAQPETDVRAAEKARENDDQGVVEDQVESDEDDDSAPDAQPAVDVAPQDQATVGGPDDTTTGGPDDSADEPGDDTTADGQGAQGATDVSAPDQTADKPDQTADEPDQTADEPDDTADEPDDTADQND